MGVLCVSVGGQRLAGTGVLCVFVGFQRLAGMGVLCVFVGSQIGGHKGVSACPPTLQAAEFVD